MYFYTSITTNYLPKARVLANSVKEHCKESQFVLVVCDKLPDNFDLNKEQFDEVWYIDDLNIPVDNLKLWIFKHTVVELCTAVKGQALLKIMTEKKAEKVVYLDPDTVVFDTLSELENTLESHDVVLTPHLTAPEKTMEGIMDNEVCTLQHGTYNLGFIAVKNSDKGLKFATWWRDRLVDLCYDNIPMGIFTDQRWIDLVPAIFDGIFIERSPAYNVSTWNLSNRIVSKKEGKYYVNNILLQFYHFSGFDSGAQEEMLERYGSSKEVFELRKWYIDAQDRSGQKELGKTIGIYNKFSNGEIITKEHRLILRNHLEIEKNFKNQDPFQVDEEKSYYEWYKQNGDHFIIEEKDHIILELQNQVNKYRTYLMPLIKIKALYNFLLKRK